MLYYLFDYLDKDFDFSGAGVFQYISFRAGMATLVSLLIAMIFGGKLIKVLRSNAGWRKYPGFGFGRAVEKKGTPTMGGIIILLAILVPTLLFAKLDNIYIILMLVSTIWLGIIGFLDDYIKVFRKNKEGLAGRFKVIGQIGLGLIVGCTFFSAMMWWCGNTLLPKDRRLFSGRCFGSTSYEDVRKSMITTIPFAEK